MNRYKCWAGQVWNLEKIRDNKEKEMKMQKIIVALLTVHYITL